MRIDEIDQFSATLLHDALVETDCLPGRRSGKVRDLYREGDRLAIVSTDRLSAFDRPVTSIPLKGRILNLLSAWWFAETSPILGNHLLSVPHPNVTIARACEPLPLEFVVRGYLTGSTSTSLWTHYREGRREYCGHRLPDGLRKNDPLPEPIVTPTTKDADGDEPISGDEAVRRGLIDAPTWERASAAALELFRFGSGVAADAGYVLADTKYEMGTGPGGTLLLVDEIHTPDSSRFWKAASLPGRLARGEEPESADKEFLRLWFADRCDPYRDEELPAAPDELRLELTRRYFTLYSALTGGHEIPFDPAEGPEAIDRAVNEGLG